MEFDFAEYVGKFRWRRWKVDRMGSRISKIFAMQYVFGLRKTKNVDSLSRRLNRIRRLWISRLRDLCAKEIWLPTADSWQSPYAPDFDFKKFSSAFRRCMFCRPALVHFFSRDGRRVKLRPCWRVKICPFCWANLTAAQYVYTRQVVNTAAKQADNFVITCRISQKYVAAPGFNPLGPTLPDQVKKHSKRLANAIAQHKAAYRKLTDTKQLRSIYGAMWRVVVIPCATGWHVEFRQLFICKPNTKLPAVRMYGSKVSLRSVRLDKKQSNFDEEFMAALGAFCRYPMELLTDYPQLVAAYLHATKSTRLIGGTGALKKVGRSLMPYMRERQNNERTAAKKKKTAAPNAGHSCAYTVHMRDAFRW